MCSSDGLTPRAAEMVGALLGDLRAAVARMHGVDPDECVIGPVDIGVPAPARGRRDDLGG